MVRLTSNLKTTDLLQSKISSSDQNLSPRVVLGKLLTGVTECIDRPVVFETESILEVTENLDQRFRLGTSVYQATHNGEVYAVKQGKGDVTEKLNHLRKVCVVKLAGVSTETNGFLLGI